MTYTAWLYHKEHGAVIFEGAEEVDRALADGWVDSPAKIEAVDVPQPEPLPVPEEIASMDKEALAVFAKDRFGLVLDKRSAIDKLQQQVAAKMAGVA